MITNELSHVAAALLKRFFRKKYPYVPPYAYTRVQEAAAAALFRKWKGRLRLIGVFCMFALPVVYGCVLYAFYDLYHRLTVRPPEQFFAQGIAGFFMPGILLGFATCDDVATYLQRMVMRGKYDAFMDYSNRQEGFDNSKSFRWLTWLLLPPFVVAYAFVTTAVIVTSPEQFIYRAPFELYYHKHSYGQVKKIAYFPGHSDARQEEISQPYYRLLFTDGTMQDTDSYFSDAAAAASFIQVLLAHGVTIDTAAAKHN